ncbi:alpha/beta hydrolase family protein [Alteromonas lipolytica]|uniref:alpha/beta hydrolase family protein n=1 Tax=Alteromonas lipolytica TaxID=1856405 RepID=UPI000B16D290|nr:S9 family peptidase [Alteromonas lipolytica]GGF63812.1 peptidase S9 [Alteromonas lipolytica]
MICRSVKLVALLWGVFFLLPAFGEPQPVDVFARLPQFYSVAMSPDGKRIAMERNSASEDLAALMTLDLATGKAYYLLKADNRQVKINWYHWANNEDLLVSARYEVSEGGQKFFKTRLYKMKYDSQGETPEQVIDWRHIKRYQNDAGYVPQFQDDIIDYLPDDPDNILMAIDISRPFEKSVFKVSLKSRKIQRLIKGKKRIRDWITDRQGNVRIGIALDYETGDRQIFLRDEDDNYEELYAFNVSTDKPVYVAGFALDPNILYIKKYLNQFKALYKLDLTTREETLVYADDSYDVDGGLIYSPKTRDAIGVKHSNAPGGRYYWDDRYAPLQKGLDKLFKGKHNYLRGFSTNEDIYLLYSESDTSPGRYYIGNQKEVTINFLFDQYPDINTDVLAEHNLITFTARDKAEIEGYLTLPKQGQAPYPTVIFPHGGPSGREYDGFDYWTAYFTSRGYAVLRPNFRGSSGYGFSFSESQMQNWGMAMQDDVVDGTQWMIDQGYADKNRICIVGASYGGFAALAATVKSPDMYQCAVSFAGVSDLDRLVRRARGFLNSKLVQKQIGEDSDDRDRRSPINYVEKIKTPILLVHGEEDRVVHVEQSRMMAGELEDEDKSFRYVELPMGNHHLSIQSNRVKFFQEMDKFLAEYL